MFGGKEKAKTEKRLTGLQQGIDDLNARLKTVEEEQRLAGRKKVRRRDPQTGRFEWYLPRGGGRAGVAIRFRCAWRGGTVRGNPLPCTATYL